MPVLRIRRVPRSPIVRVVVHCLVACWWASAAIAQDPARAPLEPKIAGASAEGQNAMRGFKVAPGLKVELAAAEPMFANPVAFFLDGRGRAFICESFRQNAGVTDNRGHDQAWLDDDLAAQSVADREAYHRKHLGAKVGEYTAQDDQIRLLEDLDGNGTYDKSTVFAKGFNRLVEGTGAGVLFHEGNVYYTCIPDLWLLRDDNGDGVAESKTSLHSGYGVRVAFRGHDLHGLKLGPDGRLYFTIGDRGYNVVTPSGHHLDPESGAVFRCELDGSRLEVFATGLRNPQELAFDDFGNLFTGDNNSDSGDRARWVYVVRGGDSGWRMSYQYLPDRGPFNREKIWHPFHEGQPAYIVPPIANFADGPSGLLFYSGVGLPAEFRDRFLLCDFRGGPANSGIQSFRLKPRGASFELTDVEKPIWNILATDLDVGPDGALYVSDWVNGWDGEGKGRLYRFSPESPADPALIEETRQLLSAGVRELQDLPRLLAHPDRRVRMLAQFELARRADVATLAQVSQSGPTTLARVHAIWGLGQIVRSSAANGPAQGAVVAPEAVARYVLPLLDDEDAEIRAQAAKFLGEAGIAAAGERLVRQLQDHSVRVQYFAAMALGDLHYRPALTPIADWLASHADQDPVLRHAGIMGLVGIGDAATLQKAYAHPSASARLALVVALRKLKRSDVARFLTDSDPRVALEAARAIHDVPLVDALPELARRIDRTTSDDAWWRRVLNANYRLGGDEHARALANTAGRSDVPTEMRLEALRMLANWRKPSSRDRVLGMWRPLGERELAVATQALRPALGAILSGPEAVRAEGAKVAAQLGIREAAQVLREALADKQRSGRSRADALNGLAQLAVADLPDQIAENLRDEAAEVRVAARRLFAKQKPEEALAVWREAIEAPQLSERQDAILALGDLPDPQASPVIRKLLDQLIAGQLPAELQLDLLEAAAKRKEAEIAKAVDAWEQKRVDQGIVAQHAESLAGGNAERGQQIFFERTEVSCVRCHKIDGRGGEVGPDLSKIAADKQRTYLLEAIVDPNRAVAKGFESATVVDDNGQVHSGVVRFEDDKQLHIVTPEGKLVQLAKSAIEERQPAKSPMPEDVVKKMSKRDLRDLVEYLSGRK